jgi:septal ring factor EnvC (AmiA/AmiB activator)
LRAQGALFLALLLLAAPLCAHAQEQAPAAQAPADPGQSVAQPAGQPAQPAPPAEELQRIEAEIEASRARVEALNHEAETLADQSKGLRRQLVDAAGKVQDQERRLSDVEARLYDLLSQETQLVDRLKARKATISDLVGALESLSVSHPPALGVSPDDATEAARSAMLLGTIIPELRGQAKKLEIELNALAQLREGIRGEQRDAVSGAHALESERGLLEHKLADLAERRLHTMASVQEEQARLSNLARNAKDLRSFLVTLSTRGLIMPRPKPERGSPGQGDMIAAGFSGHFALLKGTLRAPVVGDLVRPFGAALPEGNQSRGVVFATRENAQVVAPCGGMVVFSGPFRGYGLLLIIQADDGYHFVLSGMARVDAVARQRLLAGEPVGIMGASGVEASNGRPPELYVELRRRGEPVDPLPWLASAIGKVNG